jgi:hypothetical protein
MKGTMKNVVKLILSGLLFCSFQLATYGQTAPTLSITNPSPNFVQINWPNEQGITYRLLTASDIASTNWMPLEDVFTGDSYAWVTLPTANAPNAFFQVEIITNASTPTVQIFSPTNGQVVSGMIPVGMGVQILSQPMAVNVYLDNGLIGSIASGAAEFDLDTSHFSNGVHTLYASGVNSGNGEIQSTPISLDFENSVRWLDADPLFQSFLPITVSSDIYPANWSVFVEDINGLTVRTFSGTTSDGNIQTNWDATDNNGVAVPAAAAYTITIVVSTQGSGGSQMTISAGSATNSALSPIATGTNKYGAMEYEISIPPADNSALYARMRTEYLAAPAALKAIYPPFWLVPTNRPNIATKKHLSARQANLAQHPLGITPAGAGFSPDDAGQTNGMTSDPAWLEEAWSSGEILLARQKFQGIGGLFWDGTVANLLVNINNLIAQAGVQGDRGTFRNSVLLMNHNGDFASITNAFGAANNPHVTAFYFYGHGSTSGNTIGYKEGTPDDGIWAPGLGLFLTNVYFPRNNTHGPLLAVYTPFNFVFLDGCMTGKGGFPEAFGIPKFIGEKGYILNTSHKRAFMGWGGAVSASILDSSFFSWTLKFWSTWLGNTDTELISAINAANSSYPSVTNQAPMLNYGSTSLKWSD